MGLGWLGAVAGRQGLFSSHIPTESSCGSSALSPRRRGPAPRERGQCRCHVQPHPSLPARSITDTQTGLARQDAPQQPPHTCREELNE